MALLAAKTENRPYCLVVDEVQKIPQWSELIKRIWDGRNPDAKGINLLLLGSSRLLLQQGLSESLMGRFETLIWGTGILMRLSVHLVLTWIITFTRGYILAERICTVILIVG